MVDVTVLLPVYNGERYLRETIESILAQTYRDFELLIVDDGSTDSSLELITSFVDDRIKVLRNPERLKLSGGLNRGMKEARGKYIARMDADDIALPKRLEKQFVYMERHPDVGVCGTGIEIFGAVKKRKDIYPKTADEIKAYGLFDCPFCHPTVMMRKDLFLKHNLWYDGSYYPTEDYELWARAVYLFPTVNLDDVLLRYRVHGDSMTGSDWDAMDREAVRIIRGILDRCGFDYSEDTLEMHRNIGRGRSCRCSLAEIAQADAWLQQLWQMNREQKKYEEESFAQMLSLVWFRLCFNNTSLGIKMFSTYRRGSQTQSDPLKQKRSALLFLSICKNSVLSPPAEAD
jgi:glycosyltransferase involved in cell wall biosynthesis